MPNQDDPQLRGLLKGILRAEQAEAEAGIDAPDPEADQRIARLMAARHGRPVRAPRRLWLGASAALGSLVVIGIVLLLRSLGGTQAAPSYSVNMRADEHVLSSGAAPEPNPKIRNDSTLELNLVPQRTEDTLIHFKAFTRRDGVYSEWQVQPERKPGGAFRLKGVVSDLLKLPAGQVELVFVLSRDALPASEHLMKKLSTKEQDSGSGYQVLRASLEITDR